MTLECSSPVQSTDKDSGVLLLGVQTRTVLILQILKKLEPQVTLLGTVPTILCLSSPVQSTDKDSGVLLLGVQTRTVLTLHILKKLEPQILLLGAVPTILLSSKSTCSQTSRSRQARL